MFSIALTSLLLASASPAGASLFLSPVSATQLELRLCFKGDGQQVRYELEVLTVSAAGKQRARQSGAIVASESINCPVLNRMGTSADRHVEATVHWWVDGQEQAPIEQRFPENQHTNTRGSGPTWRL